MRPLDALMLFGYAGGMALGQILFKLSADHAKLAGAGAAFWIALLRTPSAVSPNSRSSRAKVACRMK